MRDVSVLALRDNRLGALESGIADAALLGVPENILALDKGYQELLFLGDVVTFPQNGFGALAKKIQDSPEEVYGMVRATLRGLVFSLEPRNRDEVLSIVMKQWKLSDRRLAGEMLKFFGRGVSRDMSLKPEGVQLMVDLARRDANVEPALYGGASDRLQLSRQSASRTQRAAALRINEFPIRIRRQPSSCAAWIASPWATEVNSCPARIGVPASNFRSKIVLMAGTKDDPPVIKIASTSCGPTLQFANKRSTQSLICRTCGAIQPSNCFRLTDCSIVMASSAKRSVA